MIKYIFLLVTVFGIVSHCYAESLKFSGRAKIIMLSAKSEGRIEFAVNNASDGFSGSGAANRPRYFVDIKEVGATQFDRIFGTLLSAITKGKDIGIVFDEDNSTTTRRSVKSTTIYYNKTK